MKFINQNPFPVNVTRPDGKTRIVRPYRELQAFSWRTPEDCICEGAHYAKFPGLLEPFRDPADSAPAATPTGENVGGSVVGAAAVKGRFTGTGDVISPGGAIKKDAPVGDQPPAGAAADADGDGQDDILDAALEDVPGVGPKTADALRANGYATARSLAVVEGDDGLAALAAVPFVRNVRQLIEAARNLLNM